MSDDGVTDSSAEKVSEEYFSFDMGEFTAEFPRDRLYATNHMWASEIAAGVWRFGLTAYAVRLLQDVYFLDWEVEPPQAIKLRAQIGSIESKKAESDLYSPVAGSLSEINELTLDDPSLINAAKTLCANAASWPQSIDTKFVADRIAISPFSRAIFVI